MIREVVWTSSGEADLQAAFCAQEEATSGNGERFLAILDQLLELLKRFPEISRLWQDPVRRILIRRSHHGLFYVVEPHRLVVIAVQDLRQDPEARRDEITKRLPGG